jgi:hypothetical protein
MQDIIAAVRQLPDRAFMANGFAAVRSDLQALIRPKRRPYRVSSGPRLWRRSA